MAKKKKQPETGLDRLKKMPLWQWGLIVIFAGIMSNLVMGMMPASGGSAIERRSQDVGRGVASLFFILVGVVLIVMHFVRKKRDS
ncbi:MAG TPA: hypothetical protein VMM56_09345 [Planctomycetaceae bacterium]|nr:hypothetical protein [Planctomycetaceae bacterium]